MESWSESLKADSEEALLSLMWMEGMVCGVNLSVVEAFTSSMTPRVRAIPYEEMSYSLS